MSMSWTKYIELNSNGYSDAVERSKSARNALLPVWNVESSPPEKRRMTTNLNAGNSNFKKGFVGCLNGCSEVILLQVRTLKMRLWNNKVLLQYVKVYENTSRRFNRSICPGLQDWIPENLYNMYSSKYCWSAISERDRPHSRSSLPVETLRQRRDNFFGYDDM